MKIQQPESSSSQTSINDLPECLLVKILSSLPSTDAAVQTSAVAPPWRNLWHSVGVINFDINEFQKNRKLLLRPEARKAFAEMIDRVLFQRPVNIPIQKFRLFFDYLNYDQMRSYVDSWLMKVIVSKAEELDLEFSPCDYDYKFDKEEYANIDLLDSYVFHYSALGNSSVKVLRLRSCNIRRLPGVPLSSKVHSLRELYLSDIYPLTSEELADLLATCVNLEILSLENVEFEEDWKVESGSLKHFTFQSEDACEIFDNSIEICASNLESISIVDTYDGVYYLKNTSSLVAAQVEFSGRTWRDFGCWTNIVCSLGGVERLTTDNMWCRSEFDRKKTVPSGQNIENLAKFHPVEHVFSDTFVFHNLKHVELLTGYQEDDIRGLQIFLAKCPQLETMTLAKVYKASADVKVVAGMSIVLHMPRLRLVVMKSFQKTEIELLVAGLLKKHGSVLEKVVAYPETVVGEPAAMSVVL